MRKNNNQQELGYREMFIMTGICFIAVIIFLVALAIITAIPTFIISLFTGNWNCFWFIYAILFILSPDIMRAIENRFPDYHE